MTGSPRHLTAANWAAFGLLFVVAAAANAQEPGPHDWLGKITNAVQTTNYEGTVVRIKDGKAEALKVVHLVIDGVVREKVVVQEGNGLEIIRNGNEVHCILPDKKSVLVEEWNDQSTLFSTLPSKEIRFGSEYDVSIVRHERVAGRKAIMLAIRPHDEYRFGHRIWLDIETGFPLQTKLIDDDGEAIEQVKFADINIDREISASALQPTYDIDDYRWFASEAVNNKVVPVESEWRYDGMPPGFRVVSTHNEQLPGREEYVTHILFSDGLANVSVFVKPAAGVRKSERSRIGASHSFSFATDGFMITAVGEVPAATVEKIARSMQPD